DVVGQGGGCPTYHVLGLTGQVGPVELEHHVRVQGDDFSISVPGGGGDLRVDEALYPTFVCQSVLVRGPVGEGQVLPSGGRIVGGQMILSVGAFRCLGLFLHVLDGDARHRTQAASDEGHLCDLVGQTGEVVEVSVGDTVVYRVQAVLVRALRAVLEPLFVEELSIDASRERVDQRVCHAQVPVRTGEVVVVGDFVVHHRVVVGAFQGRDGKRRLHVLAGVLEDPSLTFVGELLSDRGRAISECVRPPVGDRGTAAEEETARDHQRDHGEGCLARHVAKLRSFLRMYGKYPPPLSESNRLRWPEKAFS